MAADRTHVRFGVFDFGPDAAAVTAALGLEPSHAWGVGDPLPNRPGGRRQDARWEIVSPLPNSAPLEDQIDALLDRLEAHREAVARAREQFAAGILCAVYTEHHNPGLHLTEAALSRIAALGLSFDFDLYCLGSEQPTPAPGAADTGHSPRAAPRP